MNNCLGEEKHVRVCFADPGSVPSSAPLFFSDFQRFVLFLT